MTTATEPIAGELVHIPEPMLPMHLEDAAQAMAAYQKLTADLLTAEDWQGIPGRDQSFVKRRGWAKLATFYGVSTEIRDATVERDQDRQLLLARCIARATHPNGRYAEGDGACSITEARFRTLAGRAKLEHDLPATATTRAVNRAISNLIGFGEVSAEEMDAGADPAAAPASPWGRTTDDDIAVQKAIERVHWIAPEIDAVQFIVDMGRHFDGIPQANIELLRALKARIETARADAITNAEQEA